MNFQEEFISQFGDRYKNLHLKSVVVQKGEGKAVVTFLYPSSAKELDEGEKREISDFLRAKLALEKVTLRVKFMRVFVEKRLIMKAIAEYFDKKFKLVTSYLSPDSFSFNITPIDVQVEVELSSRLNTYFLEHHIQADLAQHLKDNFLVDFVISLRENPALVDEVDIENVQMKATYKVTQRYSVEILKNIAGTSMLPKSVVAEIERQNEIKRKREKEQKAAEKLASKTKKAGKNCGTENSTQENEAQGSGATVKGTAENSAQENYAAENGVSSEKVVVDGIEIEVPDEEREFFDEAMSAAEMQVNIPRVVHPEYINTIKSERSNVLVCGFLRDITRREFIIKNGKHAGQEKSYFNFSIQDPRGRLDCIYFSPKAYVQNMDALEEGMFVAAHGDVRRNQMGKLQLYADKLALAQKVLRTENGLSSNFDENGVASTGKPQNSARWEDVAKGHVVEIEKITALEQGSMFAQKAKYNSKIMGKTIVVFDIETTGLDRERDQIIEIGAVKIENGNIVERFSSFVKPTTRIPYDVTKLTGITNEMVEDAPPVELVIRDFYEFTRGCTISGHNVIEFDMHFIRREGQNLGLNFDNDIIDTLNEARVARLKTSRFNLATVTKLLGISLEGAHRAWNDAFATAQVLLKLNMA